MTANDPAEVGRYRSIAELGSGGMGRVLLSSAPDGSLVALKQVRAQFVEDDGFRARFRREVAASRKVSGTHTSAVIDADADAEEPWLTSEFVPGPSLQQAVTAVGALPEEAVLRMAAGLATALADIHRAGLVHRDLKPSNVLLAADGPRVIDFGIARATDSEGGTELTHSGGWVGSPGFMSPEQALGQPVGPASDVFSLGTVLVMACTGTCPFAGPAVPQTLYNVVHTEPDLGALPAKLRPLVARCLAKDPAERPSPTQLLDDIGRISRSARPWPTEVHELIAAQQAEIARLQEELDRRTREQDDAAPVAVEGPSGPEGPTGPEPSPRSSRRGFAALMATAVAVAALTATAVIALDPWRESGTRTVERPPRTTVTAEPTPAQSSPESTTAPPAPPAEEATTPDTEPSAAAEPSRQAPTRIETRPSTRPAAIADCAAKSLPRPDWLLLACGDGKAGLLDLVWSGWGTPTARATGRGWHVICEPSCADGREVQYPVTVTVTGLASQRYTILRVDAPTTPDDPVRSYRLGSNGPVRAD
ncbi:serine/threonine-protein kinase [Streptomyces sp. NPDC046465]|uniref:serine/threonine-protein kinase n=1 Tax=Streptomyces sp. NPDC046465 TaxID=3155810 RepID=UPI0033F5DA6F